MKVIASLLFTLSAASHLLAASGSPEDAAREQLAAVQKADYGRFTATMHPEALRNFKKMLLPALKAAHANNDKLLAETFFDGASVVDLEKSSPPDFFKKFFIGVLKNAPQTVALLQNSKAEVLGHVAEGTDRAHVVIRMQMPVEEAAIIKMEVISLQRDGEEWKALLSGEIQNMAAMLKKQSAR